MKNLIALCLLFFSSQAMAVARPGHDHEDLFGEKDLQLGFKLGPELTTYTTIQQANGTIIHIQPSVRFSGGGAVKFIYSFPRFEADFFWNARGGLNTSDTYHSLSVPVLVKLPLELEKYVDLEGGVGFQTDQIMFGADPHRTWMFGVLASVGLSVDFKEFLFEIEARYNVGMQNITQDINGASPRDFQLLGGMLWRF